MYASCGFTKFDILMANITGIYKITSPSGKIYIGQSIDIKRRFSNYRTAKKCSGQVRLFRSFFKHGVKNHVFEIVEECKTEQLNNRERFWQDAYECIGKKGLNIRLTTSDTKSGRITQEHKNKIGEASRGKVVSFDSRKRMSEAQKRKYQEGYTHPWVGRKHSQKAKLKMAESERKRTGAAHGKSKKVIDTVTGKIYDCVKQAAEANSLNYTTLKSRLQKGFTNGNLIFLTVKKEVI